ncbi:KEOPS complex subunit Pcc1 [Halosolutus gelatinilyticus]|uniref:KEOPS complex subunit Pcc1 n=1 Tax=Halosolutus gelatinilyticus TaxID=2931975 RepID=UPI001FF56C30|nr:KEOPS complex subunit Pcc1 [Halosolutus gelatinilyticus]
MSRRATATIRTEHDDPDVLARALDPDNTDEMETTAIAPTEIEPGAVRTRIDRETTSGLHSTVDDYVVNVDVAMRVAQHAEPTDAGPASDSDSDPDTNNE